MADLSTEQRRLADFLSQLESEGVKPEEYTYKPPKQEVNTKAAEDNFWKMMNGSYRDTGREASSPGEYLDSIVGAPVRASIAEAQKGKVQKALKTLVTSVGEDPRNKPTGNDLAWEMGIRNPYAGAAMATLLDVSANLPIPTAVMSKVSKVAPGIAGKIGVVEDDLAKLAKTEEHGARGSVEPGTRSKFKNAKPDEFVTTRDKSSKPEYLSPSTADEVKNHELYTNDDTGYALTPEKDMVGVFNNSTRKGAGQEAVVDGIAKGANTLDAIDGYLPEYYNSFGFKEKNRVKWDDQYAPEGWDYEKNGRPDIVFMEYPESLSRNPNEARARVELARSGKLEPASGASGQGDSSLHRTDNGLIDWEARGTVDHPSPDALAKSIAADSRTIAVDPPEEKKDIIKLMSGRAGGPTNKKEAKNVYDFARFMKERGEKEKLPHEKLGIGEKNNVIGVDGGDLKDIRRAQNDLKSIESDRAFDELSGMLSTLRTIEKDSRQGLTWGQKQALDHISKKAPELEKRLGFAGGQADQLIEKIQRQADEAAKPKPAPTSKAEAIDITDKLLAQKKKAQGQTTSQKPAQSGELVHFGGKGSHGINQTLAEIAKEHPDWTELDRIMFIKNRTARYTPEWKRLEELEDIARRKKD